MDPEKSSTSLLIDLSNFERRGGNTSLEMHAESKPDRNNSFKDVKVYELATFESEFYKAR